MDDNNALPSAGRPRALSAAQEAEVWMRHILLRQPASEVAKDFEIASSTVGLVCDRVWERVEQLSSARRKRNDE
jgi:hypothetical protein